MDETFQDQSEFSHSTGEVLDWLSFVGNDERKLLTLLALNRAGYPLGQTELFNTLSELSGVQKIPGALKGPFQFCEASLLLAGAVNETETVVAKFGWHSVPAKAFELTKEGEDFGVAFAGSLLQWSLMHPDLSLRILGQTHSRFSARAPLVRYWMLYDLASSPDNPKGPSIRYLGEHLEISDKTRSETIEKFKQFKIVDVESAHQNNRRQFRIIDPVYHEGERKRAFESLKPETKLLFTALQSAYQISDEWQKDDFLRLMANLNSESDPEIVRRARIILDNGLSPTGARLKNQIEDMTGKSYEGYSKVLLKPEVVDAINELVSIIDAFCVGDKEAISQGKEIANQIISSPDKVKDLFNKSYESSTLAQQDDAFDSNIRGIIVESDTPMTAKSVRNAYEEKTGRKVSTAVVNKRLGRLVLLGDLQFTKLAVSNIKQRREKHYSVTSSR